MRAARFSALPVVQQVGSGPIWMQTNSSETTRERYDDDDDVHIDSVGEGFGNEGLLAQPEPDPASVCTDGSVSLSSRVEYSALPRGQTKSVFGLVTIQGVKPQGDGASDAERHAMDIVCVLDVSGSMDGGKICQVKDATRFIIEQAQPKDRISIVSFNSHASRVLRLRKMDGDGKDSANIAAVQLSAGGGTSIAAGLDLGLQVMEQRRQRNKVSAILLLTDGQDSSTRGRLPALMTRASEAHCSVYAFGFGADHDASLLSSVAEQARTPFTFVENTENIREAFAGTVGGLSSMVAQNVELTIRSHVHLKTVTTGFTVQRPTETQATVWIPDIFAGERRDILVELVVPETGAEDAARTVLLEAFARYVDLSRNVLSQTPTVTMEADRVEEPQPEMEPDEEVTNQRQRVEVTRALREAAAQCDRGEFEHARSVLDSTDQQMKASKYKQTRTTEALAQELDEARERMRSRSQWENGGRAEVNDTCQMHSMQRCTNRMESARTGKTKASKEMYSNACQSSWIKRSRQP